MAPEVTVIVPTYGRGDRIGPTLAGALGQEDVELELIVVDDCSPDGTADLLRRVEEPRLRVLRHDVNRGVAAARNWGVREARGGWVAFLDDDDLWAPRKLREQLDAAVVAGAGVAYSSAIMLDEQLRAVDVQHPAPASEQPRDVLTRSAVPAGCSNVVARTELVQRVGCFDEELGPSADWDLFIRLLLEAPPSPSREVHVGYVVHPANMSAGQIDRHFEDFERVELKYRDARARHGATLDGVAFSRWLAGGLRRGGRRADAVRAYLRGARRYRSPGNLVRAAVVPLGEAAMRTGSRTRPDPPREIPAWLDLYRPGGRYAAGLEGLAPAPSP
jgi:glycosyltransferase involved in cell wall biosynthesis